MGSPTLLWALGAVGVVFAILNFMVGLFGAGVDRFWIGTNLTLGVVLLIAAAFSNLDALRERMRSGEVRRAGRYGTSAILTTLLSLLILGLLGFLATRYHKRFDWSEQQVHSLTSQSLKVLEGLDRDVKVRAYYSQLDQQPVRELLDRYAYESDRFRVEYADPNERPDRLAQDGITAEEIGQGLVRLAFGDESVQVTEITEEKVTNAMLKLARTGEKKVYFLEGHNERAIEGEAGAAKEGFQRAAEALRNENYRVEKLLLAAQGEVPEDADVVIVPGATRPLLDVEHAALQRYLARGGSLLALVDPRANTDLVDDLRSWGVEVGDDIVVDRKLALFGQATSPFAERYDTEHDITKDMRETTLFHLARSVRRGEDSGLTEIVFTGADSWAERDLERFFQEGTAEFDDDDLEGPVSIAVAGTPRLEGLEGADEEAEGEEFEEEQPEARLVVFGDTDFAANELIEAYRNRDLFVNSVNWLMGDVEAISIRPKLSRASRFQLSSDQFLRIRSLSLFVLPEVIAVIGVFVWWSRRRAAER
ncbi:MAG: GldG family protein [Deltaproteobacteria bacterium]|nr:GldG family protein [Deltaproteobacteria bacterium]